MAEHPHDPSLTPPVPPAPLPPVDPTAPPPHPIPEPDIPGDGTVPTFDDVRSTIEGRIAQAGGQSELDADSAQGRQRAQTEEDRATAAQEKLDQIRQSMRDS